MKCTSVAANAVNVEDFGKVIVEVLKKTHYNRECSADWTLPVFMFSLIAEIGKQKQTENKCRNEMRNDQ